jgi:hypothetical protein
MAEGQSLESAERLFARDMALMNPFAMTDHSDGVSHEQLSSRRGVAIAHTILTDYLWLWCG